MSSCMVAWMDFDTVNIIWKLLHSRLSVLLHLEWIVLQWTLCGRYFTACCQCYCSLNELCYSKHYVEVTAQHVDSVIAAWMKCVTVNFMRKVLHSRLTVLLQLEWSVLQWTLCVSYFTSGWQCYCSLNEVCYSEHYVECTAQKVYSVIAAWIKCVTVNIIWKLLHNRLTVVLQLEWSVLQWTLSGRYCIGCG